MKSDFHFDENRYRKVVDKVNSLVSSTNPSLYPTIFSCIDNTTLNGSDTMESVREFCLNTAQMRVNDIHTASVCVYPYFVNEAKKALIDTGIGVASVAGGFPAGQIPLKLKSEEVRYVVDQGADEVDIVINRGALISGNDSVVFDEVSAAKDICGKDVLLKVILETGELKNPEQVYYAAMLVMEAGADFVKTSTGKIPVGATTESAYAILSAISDFSKNNPRQIGYKAAGGLSSIEDALTHYYMTCEMLENKTIDKHCFRIGTSRITNQLFKNLTF